MKILFLGCYRDGTGWAQAATDYILSMDAAGLDVVCRPIKLNDNLQPVPERILELESKPVRGVDVCIQNVLPHYMDYNGRFHKNIALYFTETDSFRSSTWPRRINLMDEAWVSCEQMKRASQNSDVTVPIKIIPCASDVSKFDKPTPTFIIPEMEDTFIFYFIGDFIRRKNLVALLKAYHLEFNVSEPVSLFIKTSKYGMSPEESIEHVKEMCNKVKENLKLYSSLDKYKYEFIVTENIPQEELASIHSTCDCLVMPSYGEAWNIPAFDAMGFGNTPICCDVGGPSEYLKHGGGFLVPANEEPVFGMTDTFDDLYTGYENWWSIDVRKLQKRMRFVYETWKNNPALYESIQKTGYESAQKYSYENIGKLIKKELENVF